MTTLILIVLLGVVVLAVGSAISLAVLRTVIRYHLEADGIRVTFLSFTLWYARWTDIRSVSVVSGWQIRCVLDCRYHARRPGTGPDSVRLRPESRSGPLRSLLPEAARGRLRRPGSIRDHGRGQLAVGGGTRAAPRRPARGRRARGEAHPWHRVRGAAGYGATLQESGAGGVRRRAGAAAFLLQEPERGGAVPELRAGDRQDGRRAASRLPVPHPAGVPGRHSAARGRAIVEGISGRRHRHQGQLARLRERARHAARVSRIRGVRRDREVPPRHPARGRSGLHHRDGERERARDRPRLPRAQRGAAARDRRRA